MYIFIITLILIHLTTNIVDYMYPHVNWAAKTHFKYYILINILVFVNLLILIIMALEKTMNFLVG